MSAQQKRDEIILSILKDFNLRIAASETDAEGRGGQDKPVRVMLEILEETLREIRDRPYA